MVQKRYIGRTTAGPVGLSNIGGINRGASAVAQTLLDGVGVVSRLGDIAYKEGAAQREEEGLAAGAEVDLIKDPQTGQYQLPDDMGFSSSIYDQSYQKAVLAKYSATLQTDITNTLQKMSEDNFMDGPNFEAISGSYIKELIEGVDPRVRNVVASYAAKKQSQLSAGIGNRVSRVVRQNADAANAAAVKQSGGEVLSAVLAVDDGDVFDNPEVKRLFGIYKLNIQERANARFINQDSANLLEAALTRKVISVSSMSRFLKLDKIGRAEALLALNTGRGKFIDDNPGLKRLTIDELGQTARLFGPVNKGLNSKEIAYDSANKEIIATNLLLRMTNLLSPDDAKVMNDLAQDPGMRASVLLSGVRSFVSITNMERLASERKQREVIKGIKGQKTIDGLLKVLGIEDPNAVVEYNSQIINFGIKDNIEAQKVLIETIYRNSQAYAKAKTDQQRHKLNIEKLNILLAYEKNPAVRKQIESLKNNPDLSGSLVSHLTWLRNDKIKTETRLEKEARINAKNGNYEESIEASMKLLKIMNPSEHDRIRARLDDKNDPVNKTKSLQPRLVLVNQTVNNIKAIDGAIAKKNRLDTALTDAKRLAKLLDIDISERLSNMLDGLETPENNVGQVEKLVSELTTRYRALEQQAIKDRPYITAITNPDASNVAPSKSNAAYSERIGARLIAVRQSQINSGDYSHQIKLDPNDPGTWASLGLFKAGIPQRFIDVMNGVNSINDVEKIARARAVFQFLRNPKNETSIHLKAQLDGETLGRLRAVSKLGGDLGPYQEMLKAKAQGKQPVSQSNKVHLPDEFKAVRDNGTYKTDTQLREVFLEKFRNLHTRLAEGTSGQGYAPFMVRSYASKELKEKAEVATVSTPPPAFVDELYVGVMSRLHNYSAAYSDKDEAFEQAMRDEVDSMLGRGGENSWGLTKLMGRKPGIEQLGTYTLDKDVPEKFYRVSTPKDPEGISWIYDEVKRQINTQIQKTDLGPHKITFGQDKGTVFLIHTGQRSDLNMPLYHVGMYNSEGDVVHYKLFRKDRNPITNLANPITIDLGFEFQKRRDIATSALIAEKITNKALADRMTEGFQIQEKRRAEVLAGKRPGEEPPRDPDQGLTEWSGDY